jgi:hypothetical protein
MEGIPMSDRRLVAVMWLFSLHPSDELSHYAGEVTKFAHIQMNSQTFTALSEVTK